MLLPISIWFIGQFSTFNNNDGLLDPWVYFGYAHNFEDLIDRYALTYYSVRFGLISPFLLLVKLFGPINGYLVLVYALYLLAGIPFYLLIRKRFSLHAAVFAYAVLVSSPWFARTVLWTYPDSSAVSYLIAAMALMFLEPKHRCWANIAIGLLIGLAVNSNFFALSIAGLSGIAYVVFYKEVLGQKLRHDIPWMAAGFFLSFGAGMVGYYICCDKLNYFDSTLEIVKWSLGGSSNVYQVSLSNLLKLNGLYLLPFLMLSMLAIASRVGTRDRSIWLAALTYLLAVIIFFVWSRFALDSALLEYFYYFSFLLPPCLLSVVLVPVILARANHSETRLLNFALASFLLPPLIIAYGFLRSLETVPVQWVWLSFGATLLFILLAIRYKWFSAYAIVCFSLSIQISLLSTIPASRAFRGVPLYARMYGAGDDVGLSRYRLGLKFIETMPKYKDDGRPIYFWYSDADKLANSLQSTYLWGYSRVMDMNQEAPGLPSLTGVNFELFRKRSSLVLFDHDKGIVDRGIEELRRLGIRFTVKKFQEICERETCYSIAFLDVKGGSEKIERDWSQGAYRHLDVVLNWGRPGKGAKINHEGPITLVSTAAKAWNYAAVATIDFAEKPSAPRGLVRVSVLVKNGAAGLGFLGSNESRFIKNVDVHPSTEPQELYFEIDNLSELKKFVVQTWNRNRSARVQILEFAIRGQLSP